MSSQVKPTPVTVGGAQWPVLFAFRAWRALCDLHGDIEAVIDAAKAVDQVMVRDFLWAGLLWESPALTREQAAAILDEGTWAELDALPLSLVQALRSTQPEGDGDGASGEPWDWDVAEAVWVTEWHQDPAAFDQQTFKSFAALSTGRAKLYKSAKEKGDETKTPQGGWSLFDLAQMNRRGR